MASILVVDDEIDVLEALARALRIAGYTVSKADKADDAIRLCADHSFDVVVLDYIMPSMSGIELLNKIRACQPTIRSIIVSGKIDAQLSEDTLAAELRDRIEADAYLHKPLDNPRLVNTVNELLSKDETRNWAEVAERHLNAKKPSADVKEVEQSLRRLKRPKKR